MTTQGESSLSLFLSLTESRTFSDSAAFQQNPKQHRLSLWNCSIHTSYPRKRIKRAFFAFRTRHRNARSIHSEFFSMRSDPRHSASTDAYTFSSEFFRRKNARFLHSTNMSTYYLAIQNTPRLHCTSILIAGRQLGIPPSEIRECPWVRVVLCIFWNEIFKRISIWFESEAFSNSDFCYWKLKPTV